jgi:outer membrane protein assembly factor BamB
VVLGAWLASGVTGWSAPPAEQSDAVVLVVMDPLSKELACACVKGFGQRDYRKLATRLGTALGQRVGIEFSDDLAETLALVGAGRKIIVAGEPSLVTQGAAKAARKFHPVCELTGLDGGATVTGVFVARAADSAKELKQLGGRKVLLGLHATEAMHAAALETLRSSALDPPAVPETRGPGTEAALDVLDSTATPPPIAVIPSYALRLLEGCGSITPGDLKVIGETAPIPFITVFLSDDFAAEKEERIRQTLLAVKADAPLRKAMETRDGFIPVKTAAPSPGQAAEDWPDWRGPRRDGLVPRLPARLPESARVLWKKPAMTGSLAGLSVSAGRLILAERDSADEHDVYRCLNADDGELLWLAEFPASGTLDFGQSPRATPVIEGDRAYLLGAFGELRCVRMSDGTVLWKRHLPREFKAKLPTWGQCATPLIVDDLLIVNPGGPKASLVALEARTGRTRWGTAGAGAAYAAFIVGEFGGRRQVVGYDEDSLGGWDPKTGARLWRLAPPVEGDFNVPTPIAWEGSLLVSTENNGTRLYRFDDQGRIDSEPAAKFADLAPDTSTPALTNGRVFGAKDGVYCLDVRAGLKPLWHLEESALGDYATFIADAERVLVITVDGELLLLDARADTGTILSRLRVFDESVEVYSHPVLVGSRLYIRGGANILCVQL